MTLLDFSQTHRRSILFLLAMLAIAGIITAFKVPVALFPTVEFPRVMITVETTDMPAEQMLAQIVQPAEEAIKQVPGIQTIRSITSRGSAGISINFGWSSDMSVKTLQVNNALNRISSTLPPGTTFSTRQMDPSVFPILGYSLKSKTLSLIQLRNIAQYQLNPLLSNIPGVAQVVVLGGKQAEYHVTVIPARLKTLGLTIQDITQTLSNSNIISVVGRMEANYKLYLLIANTQLLTQQDIENTVIRTTNTSNANASSTSNNTGIIRLKDIASISSSTVPEWTSVNADGQEAVLLQIFQQPGGNSVAIAHAINQKLAQYAPQLPKGVEVANWYDQSQLVLDAADSVRNAIIIGTLLAAFVLWLFLRNLKITWIAIFVVPASLSITALIIYASGMSFNMMTLGGMAAAIGLIIDDAIVMLEHIIWRLRANPDHYHQRILSAALEFFRPLVGSSAATTIIFIPLAFLSGITGAFFKALSFTMASALILSFLMTWLAVPLLADHFLKIHDAQQDEGGRITQYSHLCYVNWIEKLLKKPILLLWGILPLLLFGFVAYENTGSGFMPSMDEHGFVIDYQTPPGTALTETIRLLKQVETIIKNTPGVESYSRRAGVRFGGADPFSEANEGDISVRVAVNGPQSTDDVMNSLRRQIKQQVPGIQIEIVQLMEDMIGDLTAVPQPVEIKVYADDVKTLPQIAQKIANVIGNISGIVDINTGITPSGDALMLHINPAKAALEGVDPNSISQLLTNYVTGQIVTQLPQNEQWIGVRVLANDNLSPRALLDTMLPAPDGHLYPLKRIASLETQMGQPQITRENLKRMVAVTARIEGRDMGSVVKEVQQTLDTQSLLPPGSYYELGGLYQEQQSAFQALILVLVTAFGCVFLLQLFLYESFKIAISIMCLPLLSMAAVFMGLWLTGTELNISSMMGMTMIVGIITEVAIFYFSEYQHLVDTMDTLPALIQAGKNRMRPIIMTTLAAILALLPMAIDLGNGSTMEKPLAIAIISGLIIQMPLVLLVMPTIYYWLVKTTAKSLDKK